MAVAVPLGRLGSRPAFRDQLDVDLQSRPPEHGLGRIYTKTAVGHGRLVSTSEPRGKRGDYLCSALSVFCRSANGHLVDRELPQNLTKTGVSFDQVGQ